MILFNSPPDQQIIVFGMSCSGKTTFAKQFDHYLCFDALFPWHMIETLGLSISQALEYVSAHCCPPFILDGWHLSDIGGKYFPNGTRVYVVYAEYEKIISQYRVKVYDKMDYMPMFRKWYEIDYDSLNARYFYNQGDFIETSKSQFETIKSMNCMDI